MNLMTNSQTKRIAWIDLAKFFGIFLVVYGHTLDENNLLLQFIYLFHVPLFFFISGLTYYYHPDQKKFILDKIKRLYIPYILVGLVSIVVYLLMGSLVGQNVGLNMPDFLSCFSALLYANVSAGNMMWNRPLWFLPALLVALIVANLIEAIKNKPTKLVVFVLLTSLGYYLSALRIFLPLQAETGLSMLVWIFLGHWLKEPLIKLSHEPKLKLFGLIIILTAVGLIVGFFNGTISVMVDLYGKNVFLYITCALCLSLAAVLLSQIIGKCEPLEYIGRNTLVILLWHKFPIEFFQGICPVVKDWLVSPNPLVADISALVVSIIAIYSSILLKVIYLYCLKKYKQARTQAV